MKIKVQFAGGLEVQRNVSRVPVEGEVFEGEIVRTVREWERPIGGCVALVILMLPENTQN